MLLFPDSDHAKCGAFSIQQRQVSFRGRQFGNRARWRVGVRRGWSPATEGRNKKKSGRVPPPLFWENGAIAETLTPIFSRTVTAAATKLQGMIGQRYVSLSLGARMDWGENKSLGANNVLPLHFPWWSRYIFRQIENAVVNFFLFFAERF